MYSIIEKENALKAVLTKDENSFILENPTSGCEARAVFEAVFKLPESARKFARHLCGYTMTSNLRLSPKYLENDGPDAAVPDEAMDFLGIYGTYGNQILLPRLKGSHIGPLYNIIGDGWYSDLLLLAIYNFFREERGQEVLYNYTLRTLLPENEEYAAELQAYLQSYCVKSKLRPWYIFLETNLLWDYAEWNCTDRDYRPRELWNGHFEDYTQGRCGMHPERMADYQESCANSIDRILRRSIRMREKL